MKINKLKGKFNYNILIVLLVFIIFYHFGYTLLNNKTYLKQEVKIKNQIIKNNNKNVHYFSKTAFNYAISASPSFKSYALNNPGGTYNDYFTIITRNYLWKYNKINKGIKNEQYFNTSLHHELKNLVREKNYKDNLEREIINNKKEINNLKNLINVENDSCYEKYIKPFKNYYKLGIVPVNRNTKYQLCKARQTNKVNLSTSDSERIKRIESFNHWQGISRMMNSFGLN